MFDEKAIAELKNMKPDLIIVAAYGKILPEAVLSIPGFGAINAHGSILPKFRGPSPVQNAILEGEKETGATIMLMDQGIDTGDVLSQKKIGISPDETFLELMEKIAQLSAELLLETIPRWIERKIEPQKQDDKEATLCQLIERSDGKIFWTDDAEAIYNRYRAFLPWPGVFAFWQQNDHCLRLKLNKISVLKNNPEASHHIGEVFQIGDKIGVQTTKGVVILEEIQLEGKNNLRIEEFINGNPKFIGSVLK
jgi:methionyl-tRNA formyltransferase